MDLAAFGECGRSARDSFIELFIRDDLTMSSMTNSAGSNNGRLASSINVERKGSRSEGSSAMSFVECIRSSYNARDNAVRTIRSMTIFFSGHSA